MPSIKVSVNKWRPGQNIKKSINLVNVIVIFLLTIYVTSGSHDIQLIFLYVLGVKILLEFSHYFSYLILLETLMIRILLIFTVQYMGLVSSNMWVFVFIVVIVIGACVGLSIIVIIIRRAGSNMELACVKLN